MGRRVAHQGFNICLLFIGFFFLILFPTSGINEESHILDLNLYKFVITSFGFPKDKVNA